MAGAAWITLALGLGIILVRRRSVAIGLMTAQSTFVSGTALLLASGRSLAFLFAALVLVIKTLLLTTLLGVAVWRTREAKLVRAGVDPLARLGFTLAAILLANLLIPPLPGFDPTVQRASLAVLCTGLAAVVLRRATILQLVGLLVAENGLALASISVPGGVPAVIELGALFDAVIVVSVALAFHDRIFHLLRTGDSSLLRELHD
jgi:hydrogenase-4 component E